VRCYRGSRSPNAVAGEEFLDPERLVVVDEDGVERPLAEAPEPADYPMSLSGGFEWGYGGSGPLNLAAAILCDALGFLPAVVVVMDFCDSVIAELPRLEFELRDETVDAWLDARLARGSEAARQVAGRQHI
jgi:hypothetical protein